MTIRTFFSVSILLLTAQLFAQDNIYPAPPLEQDLLITNATIHVGNGTVIPNGSILISKGRIQEVSRQTIEPKGGTKLIDAKGKQVYPGLILASSQLGLVEVPPVRATVDATEIGELNPNIRALVAYNTDSKV
ncbi:MAG: amidohydrolase, partial [Chitinophagaceae bacterium]